MEDIAHLIEGCKNQDKWSQEKLYKQFYPALFSLCKTFFREKHDVLTALNNGMLKTFKNIEQYDNTKGSFFSWVYSIVRNAALTQVRDKNSKLTFELTEDIKTANEINPFKQLEWKDIYYYLDKLPEKTRCICSLYYLEGFSIKEIASSIEMKEGTVKWHLCECRNRLKTIFTEHNFKISG